MKNEKIISRSIDILKFPLICGVVFIHNQLKGDITISGKQILIPNTQWYEAIINLCSYVLPCIAVPIFFIISGYLFIKEGYLNRQLYLIKVKKRLKSLVIPYIVWNTFGLLIYILVRIPIFYDFFPNVSIEDVTVSKILSGYWAREGDGFPFDYPLWYVRELILMVIISPFLYVFVSKMKACFLVFLAVCMFASFLPSNLSATLNAMLFFSIGLYIRICPNNILRKRATFIKYLYIILVATDLYTVTNKLSVNHYIHLLVIFTGIITVINYAFVSAMQNKYRPLFKNEVFFIYASHGLFIAYIQKSVLCITQPSNEIGFLAVYVLVPILTIIISIYIFRCMKRFSPNFLSLLVGGR